MRYTFKSFDDRLAKMLANPVRRRRIEAIKAEVIAEHKKAAK